MLSMAYRYWGSECRWDKQRVVLYVLYLGWGYMYCHLGIIVLTVVLIFQASAM